MPDITESQIADLIAELRKQGAGEYEWRIQSKASKSYCMTFCDWEEREARKWFADAMLRFPNNYQNFEVARVHVLNRTDRLLISAADALESLLNAKKNRV